MQKPILDLQNLTLTIAGKTIVNDVSFSIAQGKTLALLGESGSGKTLTALSIIRLLPPQVQFALSSSIKLRGKDLLKLPEVSMQKVRGNKIGLVFQEPATALNPVLTIGEQISEAIKQHLQLSKHAVHIRILELLSEVGFSKPQRIFSAYPHQLSGGMRQRVVIAIAIAAHPQLLIADEPTSALDVTTQAQILALLQKLQEKLKITTLLITHDVNVAKKIADKVVVLHHGHVVEQTSVAEFFAHPQHPYSQQLLQASTFAPKLASKPVVEKPILQVEDLCVYFPVQKGIFKRTVDWVKAVDNVSFQIKKGQTLALVGESGSGKSTLARAVLRLIEPTSGNIQFDNKNLITLPQKLLRPLRKDLQMIFQDPFSSLDPRMLVEEILAEGLSALGLEQKKSAQSYIDSLLEKVALPLTSKDRYPHEFSGGQRQRIVIARALAVSPQLVVCDEPTSALDVSSQKQVLELLKSLQQEYKLSYLFITHNIPLAAAIADEIAVMYEGKIVEYGAATSILLQPQHAYTKKLLAAVL